MSGINSNVLFNFVNYIMGFVLLISCFLIFSEIMSRFTYD